MLRLGVSVPISQDKDAHLYTKEDFERHQRTEWSGTDQAQAERLARCQDTLEFLFGDLPVFSQVAFDMQSGAVEHC